MDVKQAKTRFSKINDLPGNTLDFPYKQYIFLLGVFPFKVKQ